MGKINIEIDTNDSYTDKNEICFNVKRCTENEIANALRQIFLTVIKHNLVRKTILLQVINDILKDMQPKSGLGA